MNQAIVRCLVWVLVGLIAVFIVPPFITAQEEGPPIPHKLERRGDCLGCHAEGKLKSPKIPDDPTHVDSTNDICQDCHRPAPQLAIPHTMEGREDCFKCHVLADEDALSAGEEVLADAEAVPEAETAVEAEVVTEAEAASAPTIISKALDPATAGSWPKPSR